MATLQENLTELNSVKQGIKSAMQNKLGIDTSNMQFRDYPAALNNVQVGGGELSSVFEITGNISPSSLALNTNISIPSAGFVIIETNLYLFDDGRENHVTFSQNNQTVVLIGQDFSDVQSSDAGGYYAIGFHMFPVKANDIVKVYSDATNNTNYITSFKYYKL